MKESEEIETTEVSEEPKKKRKPAVRAPYVGVKEVNGVRYLTAKEIYENRRLVSRSTLKRKIKAKAINASKGPDGQLWIEEKELERFLKRNPAA